MSLVRKIVLVCFLVPLIVVAFCRGYETINRWNSDAIDPNRSFQIPNTPENNINHIEETTLMMNFWDALNSTEGMVVNVIMHMDLHETTDTDVTTFG